MNLLFFIDGVETPIVDNAVPNKPGVRSVLFYLDEEMCYRLAAHVIAEEDPTVLSKLIAPFGLKVAT